ncbi:hypothetical protein Agub_g14069, partial [Astrephomene gubernaculifera]
MAGGYTTQPPDGRAPRGRARVGRMDDAELLAPPEVAPVQLTRSMFSQPAPRPPPAPLTNHHLKKAARLNATAPTGAAPAHAAGAGATNPGGSSPSAAAAAARARSARSLRSGGAASSVRGTGGGGGRAAFSVVSDEEVIDVDGEPTTLADDDMELASRGGAGGGGAGGCYDEGEEEAAVEEEEGQDEFDTYNQQQHLSRFQQLYGPRMGGAMYGSSHHQNPHHHHHHAAAPAGGAGAGRPASQHRLAGAGGAAGRGGRGVGAGAHEEYGGAAAAACGNGNGFGYPAPSYGYAYGGAGGGGGCGGGVGGVLDPLEELEADTPAVRLAEVMADLAEAEAQKDRIDPWVIVNLACHALGHAKVVWRTMPVAVREEPLLLAKAHFALARAYQGVGCDKQAAEHAKQALVVIPPDSADKEEGRGLRSEVQIMRAESLLASAQQPGAPLAAVAAQAGKALALLVRAAGLQEPVAWTQEEVDAEEEAEELAQLAGGGGRVKRCTINEVTDMGIAALMATCHGLVAEAKLRGAQGEKAAATNSLRCAEDAASRLERRTERGDALYSPEQLDKYRLQERAFREEAELHEGEAVQLGGQAEAAYDAAVYCLNHVLDVEGRRLEEELGRERKQAHPTFRALWRRSLDLMAGLGEAYALQGKQPEQLRIIEEVLSAFAQYGGGGWLPPARHIRALKDKGALLVAGREYSAALECYKELTRVVAELFAEDGVRREVQTAEVLKLRGDVELASGDFRAAQHMFNQALELYQRHLGEHSGVAQDLLHRIDEVKAYLADARVMGRLASFPGRSATPPSAPASSAPPIAASAGSPAGASPSPSSGGAAGPSPRPPGSSVASRSPPATSTASAQRSIPPPPGVGSTSSLSATRPTSTAASPTPSAAAAAGSRGVGSTAARGSYDGAAPSPYSPSTITTTTAAAAAAAVASSHAAHPHSQQQQQQHPSPSSYLGSGGSSPSPGGHVGSSHA